MAEKRNTTNLSAGMLEMLYHALQGSRLGAAMAQ